jgi:cobalamin-dependent methionine synthase I
MSGLLVKSTAFMKDNLETFNQEGITVPCHPGGSGPDPKFVHKTASAPTTVEWSTAKMPLPTCISWIS